jgi:hypothetical protein
MNVAPWSRRTQALARTAVARVEREFVKRSLRSRPFSARSTRRRVLLITEQNSIARSQIHPFWFYRWELARSRISLREVSVNHFTEKPDQVPRNADVVVLQAWFTITPQLLRGLLDTIRTYNPSARIVFFDCAAPTDLRMASTLDGNIDLYVKKSLLSDRTQYSRPTLGDTNLTDYYQRLYQMEDQQVLFPIPQGFFGKLHVGPGFFTSEDMLQHFFSQPLPPVCEKTLDVHARLGSKGTPWYSRMRSESLAVLAQLDGELRVVKTGGVERKQYLRELAASRICLSPFGYGEIAWRDYEAVMCGALLLKPDMSHCETDPSIFVPHETYVPIKWDFSDMAEKIRYYLDRPKETAEITARAYRLLHTYCKEKRFLQQMERVLSAR